jgi:hypothetical protein
MSLITEAVRRLVIEYGDKLSAAGFDSNVYLEHFRIINPVNTADYGLVS